MARKGWDSTAGRWSLGGATVVAKHATESFAARNVAGCRADLIFWINDPVRDPLVVSLSVAVGEELTLSLAQRREAEEDHPVQALVLDSADEPLGATQETLEAPRPENK